MPAGCIAGPASQFGMSTGRASRACLLNSALLETGAWCKSTAFRQPLQAAIIARVAQRCLHTATTGGLIPRIALDECRDPEHYRTRAPAFAQSCGSASHFKPLNAKQIERPGTFISLEKLERAGCEPVEETGQGFELLSL
jgi:hypothetical protein